ncbi:MAG: hypothetical protein ACI4XM_07855 [Candidatus Coprovivens sp.]
MSNTGLIKNFTLENGYSFEAYIPNNVNSDTKIIIYEHGDGGYTSDWDRFTPQFNSGLCNAIVIHADRKYTTDLAACVASQYNINIDNAIPVGFSGGGVYACYSAADIASQSTSGEPNLAVLLEGSCPFYYLESQGVVDAYKNNNTVFLYFENDSGYQQTQYAKAMAESGVNVLIFEDYVANGHTDISASFITSGLLDFAIGEGALPERYVIKAYNKDEGWHIVDPSTITNIDLIYNLFGLETGTVVELTNYTLADLAKLKDLTLNSSQKDLERYLNGIRGAIRSTSISTAGITGGFSSTTMMPSQVPAIVSRYIESTTSFLSKLANETDQFAMIGESIKRMDFNLERLAKEINNIDIVSAVYGNSSQTTTDVSNNGNNKDSDVVSTLNEVIKEGTTSNNTAWSAASSITNSNTTPSVSQSSGNYISGNNDKTYITSGVVEEKNEKLYEFYDYDDLVTNDERLVVECFEGYKIVVHNENGSITGVEHYYDFGTESNANNMLSSIKAKYEDKYFFEEVLQEGQYIKVILNNDVYKDYTISSLEELYSKVNGYAKV